MIILDLILLAITVLLILLWRSINRLKNGSPLKASLAVLGIIFLIVAGGFLLNEGRYWSLPNGVYLTQNRNDGRERSVKPFLSEIVLIKEFPQNIDSLKTTSF